MAEALLISRKDVVKFTAMNGNVDTDKFIQYVKIAQDKHIENYLGTDLLNKIQTDIIASNLSGDYLTLVNSYVKPALLHFTMVEYLSFNAGSKYPEYYTNNNEDVMPDKGGTSFEGWVI